MKYERDKSIFLICSKLLWKKGVKTKFHTSSIFMSIKQEFVPSPGLLLTVLEKQRTNRRWCILENAVTWESIDKTSWGGRSVGHVSSLLFHPAEDPARQEMSSRKTFLSTVHTKKQEKSISVEKKISKNSYHIPLCDGCRSLITASLMKAGLWVIA